MTPNQIYILREAQGSPLWWALGELARVGATDGIEICKQLGLDPHVKVGEKPTNADDDMAHLIAAFRTVSEIVSRRYGDDDPDADGDALNEAFATLDRIAAQHTPPPLNIAPLSLTADEEKRLAHLADLNKQAQANIAAALRVNSELLAETGSNQAAAEENVRRLKFE